MKKLTFEMEEDEYVIDKDFPVIYNWSSTNYKF